MRSITLNVKGTDWTFRLLGDKAFTKKHKSEEGEVTEAITILESKVVEFNKIYLKPTVVIHELTHVFFGSSLVETASLDKNQVEEVMCEINAHHIMDIVAMTNKILQAFMIQD